MNTIKLSNYGVTITNANIGRVNAHVAAVPANESLTLDFEGIRGIDSEVAKQLLTLLHSRQGGQVFIKNTEPMVKSVLIFSGRIGIPDAVADAPVRKSAPRHFALFSRLFSLLLLFALSFGFSSQAWGTDSHFCLGGDPINGQWSKNTTYKIGTGYGENNKYYIIVYMKNGEYFCLYQENAGNNDTKRYCPDNDVEVQPGNGGSQGQLHENNDNCKAWKYVGETGYVKVCIDVNDKEYNPYVWVEKYQFLTDDLKDVLKGNKVQFYFGDQRGDGWRHLFTKSGHKSEDRAWFAAAVHQGSCFVNSSDWGNFRWAPASVASVNYYLSDNNDDWDGLQIGESAAAGKAYMLYDQNDVKIAKGDNHSGASFNNASSTITRGTSASGLSATLSHQISVINATNSIKYYITSDNFDNYNEFDPTNASGLDAGTYTVAAVVTDGNIYVKAATATLTVTEPTYSVTINNGDHGTVSPNGAQQVGASGMNLTVTPNDCYYHTGWNTTGGASVSDNKVTATAAGSVTALYSERWVLRGSETATGESTSGMPGWSTEDAIFTKDGSGNFVKTVTLLPNREYKFMVYDRKENKQCGYTTTETLQAGVQSGSMDGTYHLLMNTSGHGIYTFTVIDNDDHTAPQITITNPAAYKINMGKSGEGTIDAIDDESYVISDGKYVRSSGSVTFTAHPTTNYEVEGWYSNSECTDKITAAGKETSYTASNITAETTVYVKFKGITHNIIYPQNPENYQISANAIQADYNTSASFTLTPDKGYLLTVTTNQSVTLQRNGNTYTIPSMPAGDVTILVTPCRFKLNMDQDIEFNENWQAIVSLDKKHDYTFKLHNEATDQDLKNYGYFGNNGIITSTITSPWTMEDSNINTCTLKTGVAGNYVFTYSETTENDVLKHQITVTYPDESKIVIQVQNQEDIVLPLTLLDGTIFTTPSTSLTKSTSYTFDLFYKGAVYGNNTYFTAENHTDWVFESTNRTQTGITTDAVNDCNYSFIFNSDGNKLTAVYPSYWMGNIATACTDVMTFNEDIATFEKEIQSAGDYTIQVVYDGQKYGTSHTKATTSASDIQMATDQANPLTFSVDASMTGTYHFTFNKDTKILTVQYPDNTRYDITYTDAEGTKIIQAGPTGGLGITAAEKPGYRFTGWVLSPNDINKIDVASNDLTQQTTTVYGKSADCSITATYSNENFVYFKNVPGWNNVYVYFYNGSQAFDTSNDKRGIGLGGENNESLVDGLSGVHQMTHIDKTDIWYYDYSAIASSIANLDNGNKGYIAFTSSDQNKHQFFDQCQVVYRGDFDVCAPMMVPINYIDQYLNKHDNVQTCYYQQGHWMKYDAAENEFGGIYLHIYDNVTGENVKDIASSPFELKADNDGSYSFHSDAITLPNASHTYGIKLSGCADQNATWYGNSGTMTSNSCTNWVMSIKTDNMGFEATTAGPYTFRLSTGNGQLKLSAEYPLANGDYRVLYHDGDGDHLTGYTYKANIAKTDTASFFYDITKSERSVIIQKCTNASANPATWENVTDGTFTAPNETGIYNFIFTHDASGNITEVKAPELYKGKFYVRSEGVDGGMESYIANADNEMSDYGSMLDAGVTYDNFQFDFYKAKWITSGKDVSFCIANDYNENISSMMRGDNTLGGSQIVKLPQSANVRFMWNSETNQLKRAYISGSTIDADRYLMLIGNDKMYDAAGKNQITELKFTDKNNWVYQANIKAQPGCAVKMTANYDSRIQYFIGAAEGENATKTIISGTGDTKYTMRAIYDFKTNRLVAGWVPDNQQIDSEIKLGGDMLITRTHQGDAQQITFGVNETTGVAGSISDIHHVYGVLTLQKDVMTNANTMQTGADGKYYENNLYWISFPFDVKISEIFGVDGYGTKWIMQRYRGDLRAQKGWFAETPTFWEYMSASDTLKAYEGYVLCLDPDYFNPTDADVWKNSATEANFYFPSADNQIGLVNAATFKQSVPAHECTINRTFDADADHTGLNHMITDSHWNVIGVPAFQNAPGSVVATYDNFKSFYEWNPTTNDYKPQITLGNKLNGEGKEEDGYVFKTMHAYMVQFYGGITWTNVSMVKVPESVAPRRLEETANYMAEIEFHQGNKANDHTYINLADNATTDFLLNEDMMKIDNAGCPNIYSFAGNYNVAYNETSKASQIVDLGVSAPAAGNYKFHMPSEFTGTVTLIDNVEQTRTDLQVQDYELYLDKGTYNDRFQLEINLQSVVTNLDNVFGGQLNSDHAVKFIRDDKMFILRSGHIFDATGKRMK